MAKGKPKPSRNGHRRSDQTPALFPEITHPGKRAFLTAFVTSGSRQQAADAAQMDIRNHWYWLEKDPAYADAFARATHLAADSLEDRLIELGRDGYEEGVWHKGEMVGTQRRFLPTLLLAAVNAHKPDLYRWRGTTEHTVSPSMAVLQQQWLALRDAPLEPPRQLPPMNGDEGDDQDNTIEVKVGVDTRQPTPPLNRWQHLLPPSLATPERSTPECPRERPQGASKAEIFGMLDALQGMDTNDDPDEEV